ncbi:MAG: thioredoxin family protein, partial [Candidatus Moraniibacteriota bacterium]
DTMMPDAENAGQYEDYTKSAFDQAVGKRRVLFFYANWCPICRPADSDIRANVAKLPADVAGLRVNYNDTDTDSDEKALAKEYGVTYQHTFVQIDSDGNVVTKWNGGKMAELLNNIK